MPRCSRQKSTGTATAGGGLGASGVWKPRTKAGPCRGFRLNRGSVIRRPLHAIADDPEDATIESDNAESLLSIYRSLGTDDEHLFRDALLARVAKDTEYAPVGYMALLVFLRLGDIAAVLAKARNDLRGDSRTASATF